MESVGARLKKIRLEKGLSLEEVHKKTKIHLSILKAIEEDSLIKLSPIYIKGFLKIYCKFLGVDPKEYMADYKEPQSTLTYTSGTLEKPASLLETMAVRLDSFKDNLRIKINHNAKILGVRIKTVFVSLLIFIFLIGLFNLGRVISSKRRSLISKKGKITAGLPVKTEKKARIDKTQKIITPTINPKAKHSVSNEANLQDNPSASRIGTETKATLGKGIPQGDAALGIRLGIYARENCYIHYLKTDGKVVFQGILKKGSSESWQAKNKIEFSLGNAGVVDLEVNGKHIMPLGRKGQAIKNIEIDKEGLKIR